MSWMEHMLAAADVHVDFLPVDKRGGRMVDGGGGRFRYGGGRRGSEAVGQRRQR